MNFMDCFFIIFFFLSFVHSLFLIQFNYLSLSLTVPISSCRSSPLPLSLYPPCLSPLPLTQTWSTKTTGSAPRRLATRVSSAGRTARRSRWEHRSGASTKGSRNPTAGTWRRVCLWFRASSCTGLMHFALTFSRWFARCRKWNLNSVQTIIQIK